MSDAGALDLPRVVLFDLDGTLLDSLDDLTAATNQVTLSRRGTTWPAEQIRRWIGEGAELLIARCLTGGREHEATPAEVTAALAEFRAIYIEHCCERSTLAPRALETLDAIRSLGLATAVLTNKPTAPTGRILDHYGLTERLDAWLGGDAACGRKPRPEPVLAVAELALKGPCISSAIWLVGDSVFDIAAARNAGAGAIAIRGGFDAADPVDTCEPRPHLVLDRLADLIEVATACIRSGGTPR